jgi:hypothetical protein
MTDWALVESRHGELPIWSDDLGGVLADRCKGQFDIGDTMARTYREIAIEQMLGTVEEAMSQVINWWADLPPPMKEAMEQFRTQLGEAIDSVELVKRALDREVHDTDRGRGPS